MILTESQQQEVVIAESVQSEIRPPWIVDPYALTSWWTMEEFAADKFCRISGNISLISQQYANMRMDIVPSENRLSLAAQLSDVATICEAIGLRVSALQLKDGAHRIVSWEQWTSHSLAQFLIGLNTAINSEMSTHLFMRIFPERQGFYEQEELFGPLVDISFSSARKDIKAAGSCYAADRNTACVMHLMRVLEVGLNTLARTLGVPCDRRNWENVINDIEAAIKKVAGPSWGVDWRQKQQFYSGAAKDFRYFKEAWRNHAMHFREHYEGSEAKAILEHVKAFMAQLADGGLKE